MQTAMRKNALSMAAFVKNPRQALADVRVHGKKLVVENDRPAFVVQTAEEYERIMDMLEDTRVEQIAAERLSKPMGEGITFEEYLKKHELTQEYLDSLPEVEIG